MSSIDPQTPQPTVMPIDREAWQKQLHLSNFVNTYCAYRDITRCAGEKAKVLIIGPGQGLDGVILKWRGMQVTTFDIDTTFAPDVIGSCHDMPMFEDGQFDVVLASHVLEHLPLPYLNLALAEIARIGRHAVFYLPVSGRHALLRFAPGFKGLDFSLVLDFMKFWERPDGVHPRYCGGQHFWEVGHRGFTVAALRKRFENCFTVLDCYRNKDWLPSQNFVLASRPVRSATTP